MGRHLWLIAGWDPGHQRDGGDILADLWRLDLEMWAWKQITPQVHYTVTGCPPYSNDARTRHWRIPVACTDKT